MFDPHIAIIMSRLSESQRRDLTSNWDAFCDGDRGNLRTDDPQYPATLEAAGFVEWDSVDADDLEDAFAWERGIEPGGTVYRLTPLGMKLRKTILEQPAWRSA